MSCGNKKNECCKLQQENKQDYLVCTCMGVMHDDIVQSIKNGATTFEQLSEILGVGTGCSSCVQEVHDILKRTTACGCCKT